MARSLSHDLRIRVLMAVAERFGVSAASVSRWRTLQRERGDVRARSQGGDRRSGRIEAQGALIRSLVEETPDIAIEELRRELAERGHPFGFGTLQRFFARHGITRKKRQPMRPSRTDPTS